MAYNIVKHRRGTTEEWQASTLVPSEGELVIEECYNGFHRVKVGDGIHSWNGLDYVDSATYKELNDNFVNNTVKLVGLISDAVTNINTKIDSVESGLYSKIAADREDLTIEYSNADRELLDIIEESTDNKIFSLQSAIEDKISEVDLDLQAQISAKLTEAKEDVRKDLKSEADKLAEQITNSDINLSSMVDEKLLELNDDITCMLYDEVDAIRASLENSIDNVSALKNSTDLAFDNVDKLVKGIETRIDNISDEFSSSKKDICDRIDSIGDATEKLADDLATSVSDSKCELNSKIEELYSEFHNKIEKAKDDLQSEINILSKKHADEIHSTKNTLSDDLGKLKAEHEDKLSLESAISLLDSSISNRIATIEKQNSDNIEAITNTYEELRDRVTELDNNDVALCDRLHGLTNSLSDFINKDFSSSIEDINGTCAEVKSELDSFISTQNQENEDIRSYILEYVLRIYAEIYDLVDDDITILERVYSFNNILSDRIDALQEDISVLSGGTNESIEKLSLEVQARKSEILDVSNRLDGVVSYINETKNSYDVIFADIYTRIGGIDTRIDAVESRVSTAENEIITLKNTTIDINLRPDIDTLTSIVNDSNTGLSSAYRLADAAADLAYLNTSKIVDIDTDIKNNYIRVNDESMCVDEDVIIFCCGDSNL